MDVLTDFFPNVLPNENLWFSVFKGDPSKGNIGKKWFNLRFSLLTLTIFIPANVSVTLAISNEYQWFVT